jgi:ribosomal protein L11 methyltransferase
MRPFALGRRFVVLPRDAPIPDAMSARIALRLVPGRAFGTGEHATTRLAVELLEETVGAGSRWVDVGCGTAILAVVARELGAAEVLALDDDPTAIEVAREVLCANEIDGVRLELGTIDAGVCARWDGVVANVSAVFARDAAPAVAAALVPGGHAVLTGFLAEDAPDVIRSARSAGLDEARIAAEGPWRAVLVTRRAGSGV